MQLFQELSYVKISTVKLRQSCTHAPPLLPLVQCVRGDRSAGTASSCPNPARLSALDLVPTIASYVI